MVRLAIHAADIEALKLPPQRIKGTDSRAAGFKGRFGAKAATSERAARDELRERVRNAIEGLIVFEPWNRQVAVKEAELKCIAEFAETFKNLPEVQK
jgi:hypothetical protein